MHAVAPNLSALIGELVGARLISHAGSLTSLAKYPASTVQILGAEKALFRCRGGWGCRAGRWLAGRPRGARCARCARCACVCVCCVQLCVYVGMYSVGMYSMATRRRWWCVCGVSQGGGPGAARRQETDPSLSRVAHAPAPAAVPASSDLVHAAPAAPQPTPPSFAPARFLPDPPFPLPCSLPCLAPRPPLPSLILLPSLPSPSPLPCPSLQGAEDQGQHPQVRPHLPLLLHRPRQAAQQGAHQVRRAGAAPGPRRSSPLPTRGSSHPAWPHTACSHASHLG